MKKFVGSVLRASASKTVHVQVLSEWMHPKYGKKINVRKVFACHDLLGAKVGESVVIIETKPMSATKFFAVESIVGRKAEVAEKKVVIKKEVKPKEKKTKVKAK